MPRVNTKSLRISEDTKARLDAYRQKGETYDQVVALLLEVADQARKMEKYIRRVTA